MTKLSRERSLSPAQQALVDDMKANGPIVVTTWGGTVFASSRRCPMETLRALAQRGVVRVHRIPGQHNTYRYSLKKGA